MRAASLQIVVVDTGGSGLGTITRNLLFIYGIALGAVNKENGTAVVGSTRFAPTKCRVLLKYVTSLGTRLALSLRLPKLPKSLLCP